MPGSRDRTGNQAGKPPGKPPGQPPGKPHGSPVASLVEVAVRARGVAHAPYSRYAVGAALSAGDPPRIFEGANVENASYGLTVCAERVAVFRWVTAGRPGPLTAIAVAAGPQDAAPTGGRPCGACLQVLREFAVDLDVYIVEGDRVVETRLSALLPDPFVPPSGPGRSRAGS